MDEHVQLTVKRYEELREIERERDKWMSNNLVCIRRFTRFGLDGITRLDFYDTYESKESVIAEMAKVLEEAKNDAANTMKRLETANADFEASENLRRQRNKGIANSSFFARLKYLFTKELR